MTETPLRLMRPARDLGRRANLCVGEILFRDGKRELDLMGFKIPTWQRPIVWTPQQNISLVENLWSGVEIGTYTYNQTPDYTSPLDRVLIDGQQRMNAIRSYLRDEFTVQGYLWSEITKVDRRFFGSLIFGAYITSYTDEEDMKKHYNMLNFSGVAHTEDQRA